MEKLIRENVIKHLDENVLISRQQHGFVQGRSCVTQLLDVMDAWTEILDAGGSVDIIYMDFMKAFDSVPHRRLLMKLAAYGIQGKMTQSCIPAVTSQEPQLPCKLTSTNSSSGRRIGYFAFTRKSAAS
ncbi:hypothetical protein ACOMHN_060031 [Nucella lapillus]